MQLQNQISAAIQLSKPVIFGHRGGFGGGFGDVDATWRWGPPVSPPLSSLSLLFSPLLSSPLTLRWKPPSSRAPLELARPAALACGGARAVLARDEGGAGARRGTSGTVHGCGAHGRAWAGPAAAARCSRARATARVRREVVVRAGREVVARAARGAAAREQSRSSGSAGAGAEQEAGAARSEERERRGSGRRATREREQGSSSCSRRLLQRRWSSAMGKHSSNSHGQASLHRRNSTPVKHLHLIPCAISSHGYPWICWSHMLAGAVSGWIGSHGRRIPGPRPWAPPWSYHL